MSGGFEACAHVTQIAFSDSDFLARDFRLKIRVGESTLTLRREVECAVERQSAAGLRLRRKEILGCNGGSVAAARGFQGAAHFKSTWRGGTVVLICSEPAHGQSSILPASLDVGARQQRPEDGHGVRVKRGFGGRVADGPGNPDVS
jgi:hypothetical protein